MLACESHLIWSVCNIFHNFCFCQKSKLRHVFLYFFLHVQVNYTYLFIQSEQSNSYLKQQSAPTAVLGQNTQTVEGQAVLFVLVFSTYLFVCLHLSAMRIWSSGPCRAPWSRRQSVENEHSIDSGDTAAGL